MFFFVVTSLALAFTPVDLRVASIITQITVFLGGALVFRYYYAHPNTQWPSLRSVGISPLALLVVMLTSVALGLMSNALIALKIELFPTLGEIAEEYQETIEELLLEESMSTQIVGAIAVAVVAPVCEEVLFRGTMLPEQRRRQTAVGAIILNGVLFALMHLHNPVGVLALTLVGAYFAHITLRSDTLWPAIAGHAALNLVNGVILLRVADRLELDAAEPPEDIGAGEVAIITAVLAVGVAFLWWLSIWLVDNSEHSPSAPTDDDPTPPPPDPEPTPDDP